MHIQDERKEWERLMGWRQHESIFGRLSLWMIGAAAVIAIISFLLTWFGPGEGGMIFIIVGLGLGGIMCMTSFALALIGLARCEAPRWPAITGLALSALPALGGIYLLCGAPL